MYLKLNTPGRHFLGLKYEKKIRTHCQVDFLRFKYEKNIRTHSLVDFFLGLKRKENLYA